MGAQALTVVLSWRLYEETGRLWDLGLLGLAQFAPTLPLALISGYVVDRFDRSTILRVCYAVQAIVSAGLYAQTVRGGLGAGSIFLAAAVGGATRSFLSTSYQAVVPALSAPLPLPRAVAASNGAYQLAVVVGPVLGGLLMTVGLQLALLVSMLFALAATLCMPRTEARRPTERAGRLIDRLFGGWTYVWGRKDILALMTLDFVAVTLSGATALLPVLAKDVLHASAAVLGLLRCAPALGALAASAALARWDVRDHVSEKLFGSVAIYGSATIALGLSDRVGISLVSLVIIGASDTVSVVIRRAWMQQLVPESMRGRVAAVNSLLVGSSNQLGEFESGAVGAMIGTVPSIVLGGIGAVLASLTWPWMFPVLRVTRMPAIEPDRH